MVMKLVKSGMENQRSIMLAVISANNERAKQVVLQFANEIDPEGSRTLGIITKPDTLDAGSEKEQSHIGLAQNSLVTSG